MENKESIKAILRNFESQYKKADSDNLESFVREFFIDENDTSLVGAGLNSWCFGLKEIGDAIKSYWQDERMYLENIDLDIDKALISVKNSVAVVALDGKNTRSIKSEKLYEDMMKKLDREFEKEGTYSTLELVRLSKDISKTMENARLGEEVIWPFRVTILMINNGAKWMIKHMNLSFCHDKQEILFNNENIDEKFKVIAIDKKDSEEIRAVKKVLSVLQEGYDKRDCKLANEYAPKLFDSSDEVSIIGTCQGETFKGFDGAKELLEGDWECWGDFKINVDDAYISVYEDMAIVCARSFVKFTWNKANKGWWSTLPKIIFEDEKENKKTNKEIVESVLGGINQALNVIETPEDETTAPIKFIGVLVKKEGEWKFNHMHFSHVVDEMPQRLEV